jgi:ABC-type lipoprotein export system ATPase subunit
MEGDKIAPKHTALIIPDGRTRIWQKYPHLEGIKIPAEDMFIGKMSSLCRQYAKEFYLDNWFILTTNDEGGSQLVRYNEKITGEYDNPPYPLPGVIHKKGPDKGRPKYWRPFSDQIWEQLNNDVERLRIREKYSRIHFLGNGIQDPEWKQQYWDKWIEKNWNKLKEDQKKSRDLEIYKVYKSAEYEYSLYIDVINELFGNTSEQTWLEYPLRDYKTKPEMISRITDAISRKFPLRNNTIQLQSFTVKNLFRMGNPTFTYEEIPLTNGKGIQILTAPNGFGKSTLFRLIRAVLRGNLREIAEIPFSSLNIIMIDREKIIPLEISISNDDDAEITICHSTDDKNQFKIKQSKIQKNSDLGWSEGESLKLSRMIPPITIRFLSSDRLWFDPLLEIYEHDLLTDWDAIFSKPDKPRIEQYAESLSKRIEGTLNNYASTSHEIDTIFPLFDMKREDRIIRSTRRKYKVYEQLYQRFEILHKQREYLEEIDFLPYRKWYRKKHDKEKTEEVDPFEFIQKHDLHTINTLDYQNFLDFYLKKQQEKYSVFEWLRDRCKLFTNLVEGLLVFTKVRIRRDTGLSFYHAFASDSDKTIKEYHDLNFNQLSSGEKHQIILIYDFIFNCDPGTLVFIDEPEISLHIVWQDQFINNLKKISEKNSINFLIATHSTDIIGDNWDIATDLLGGSYS